MIELGNFSFFGPSHLFVIGFTCAGLVLIYVMRNASEKTKLILKIAITSTLVFQLLLFNGWHIYHNSFLIHSYLPFHLCSMSAYCTIVALIWNNRFFRQFAYYIGFISAWLAVVSPDVRPDQNFPSFRFIEFFLSHVFIVFGLWYLLVVQKITVCYKHLWISFGLLFVIMLLIFPINQITGGNYFFLNQKPASGGLFALFPPEPYHVLALIPLTNIIMHLEYGFAKLLSRTSEN